MLKKMALTGLLISSTFALMGQSERKESSAHNTITDNSIVYPADMERNYDELLSNWGKNVKYADNCRSNSDEAVSFHDSVYIQRLYSLPTQMELAFNPVVRDYIEMYAGRRRNQVSYMLATGKFYYPIFEEALDKEGMPLELKYLPVIESALNPIARSRVGATGLWQFMAGTGKMYDLEINSLVDERRDPHKATEAAVRYLKDLYKIYGDWNLVIAAYNCGPGNVNKAIRRSGGQTDYWTIYPYLPKETRGYVPAFIAATYIMSYHNEHNICPAEFKKPTSIDSLVIDKNIHFQQIAEVINVSLEDLREFNPQFKSDIIPGDYKEYALNLPMDKISAFLNNKNAIYTYKTNELLTHRKEAGIEAVGGKRDAKSSFTHRVKKGETMARLATRYGVTAGQIKQWNGLSSNKLAVGRRLKIYRSENDAKKAEEQSTEKELASNSSSTTDTQSTSVSSGLTKTTTVPTTVVSEYRIRKGDTWAKIAQRNGVTVTDLKSWNNVKKGLIAGKDLTIRKVEYTEVQEPVKLPEPELAAVAIDSDYSAELIGDYVKNIIRDDETLPLISIAGNGSGEEVKIERKNIDDTKIIYHKVRIGETITQIAARYNVSKDDIISWNKLPSSMAKVGQRLLIYLPEQNRNSQVG